MSLKSTAASGIKSNGVASIIIVVLQAIQLVVLARILSPEDFGLMAMIEVVIGIARIFTDLGVGAAIIYKLSITDNELSSLYWLNYLAGLFVAILVFISRPLIAGFYNEDRLIELLGWISIVFFVAPIGQQYQVLMQKRLEFNRLAVIDVISSSFSFIVTIILAITGIGVLALIIGEIVRTFVRSMISLLVGLKFWKPSLHFKRKDLSGFVGFGLFQMGEKVLNYFNQRIDQILIGWLLGAEILGYYTLAYNIALAPFLRINPILTRVAFPTFSKLQNNVVRLRRGYLKLIKALSLINFPILIGIAIISSQIILNIFGSEWVDSIRLLQLLAFVALIRSIVNPVGSLLLAKGRADLGFYWNLAILLVHFLVIGLGIHFFGIYGVAWALIILYSIHLIVGYWILIRPLIGSCLNEYLLSFSIPLAISVAMGVVVYFFNLWLTKVNMVNVILLVLIGAIVYILFCYLVYGKELVAEVRQLVSQRVENASSKN